MATPPTQATGSPFTTTKTGSGTKTAGGGLSVGVGDLVVVIAVNEDSSTTIGAPTNTGTATVSWTPRSSITTGSHCAGRSDTGVVTGAGTLTVSQNSTANNWGYTAWVCPASGHGGVGQAPTGTTGAAAGPTQTPASAWSANSMVCCGDGDWAANAIGTRAYRTNLGTATEVSATNADGNYSCYFWYHADAGASPASGAVGMTAPTQTYTLLSVEVLGTSGGTTQVSHEWELDYAILNQVSHEWQLAYDIKNQVSREWELDYAILNQVSGEWAIAYDIKAQVAHEWELDYDIKAQVAQEWQLAYDIIGPGPVANEWQLAYDIKAQASNEWVLKYDLLNAVAREWELDYNIIGQTANEWALKYNIGAVALPTGDLMLTWLL